MLIAGVSIVVEFSLIVTSSGGVWHPTDGPPVTLYLNVYNPGVVIPVILILSAKGSSIVTAVGPPI